MGKPLPAPNPEAIDRDEWDHFQKDAMTVDEMKKVLNQLPSRIGNAIVSAALPSIAESVSQSLAAQLFQSLSADYLPQSTTPGVDAPTQPTTYASSPTLGSQQPSPVSNGFSPETNAVSNGFALEPSPVSNGFSPETNAVSNGFSPETNAVSNGCSVELDADGLPTRNLPPCLPARCSASRQVPRPRRSASVSNGKLGKDGKVLNGASSDPIVRPEQLRLQCDWSFALPGAF